jgi:transposase-like protein
MQINCPSVKCFPSVLSSPNPGEIIRHGYYFRKSDSRVIRRFYCKKCDCSFSYATLKTSYRQKKRRITAPLKKLLVSGVSQRRAALILGVDRKTVVRRFRFLASEARLNQAKWLKTYKKAPLQQIQFDDLETSEHSKCKPLSVTLAVDPIHRKILGFQVNKMPAKGLLARRAILKYGYRPDERHFGWDALLKGLIPITNKNTLFTSDDNPHYGRFVKMHHPHSLHFKVKGGRGSLGGQGELKKLKFDPIFSLNHTCAMLRANLNRLFRKTWCTTKNKQGLIDHLSLYVEFHNQVLTRGLTTGLGAS